MAKQTQIASIRESLDHLPDHLIKLLPAPAKYSQLSVDLELPDIHHCLLDLVYVSSLNIESTNTVQHIRLFAMFRPPLMQHRKSMQEARIKVICPDIRSQRQRQQMISIHLSISCSQGTYRTILRVLFHYVHPHLMSQ